MKPTPNKVQWTGTIPVECDMCHGPIRKTFYDGKTVYGPWAIMCSSCYVSHGHGLGTGRGQQYDAKTGSKIAG